MPDHSAALDRPTRCGFFGQGEQIALTSARGTQPNIAMEDVPGRQTFFAGTLTSPRQRFETAVGNAGGQINEVILACVHRR